MSAIRAIFNSFPIRLLLVHIKHNQFLLLYWFILFSIVAGRLGKNLGIHYLFLDPIYLDKVGFWGFFIIGVALAGFIMAFNITSYILDGFRFPFLGTLPRPFSHYCLNNALIPLVFLVYYVIRIVSFQRTAALYTTQEIALSLAGLFMGIVVMLVFQFIYFYQTNKDVRKVLRRRKKRQIKVSRRQRINAFKQLKKLRRTKVTCDNYFSLDFGFHPTKRFEKYYDRVAILKVFKHNQQNAITIELLLLVTILGLGIFQNTPLFQIPAAASSVLLMTTIVMLTGALSYWLRSWVVSAVVFAFIIANLVSSGFKLGYEYPAFGLDYGTQRTPYNLSIINSMNSAESIQASKEHWLAMLDNWKSSTGKEKPRMFMIAVSGGGQRSALWTTNVLQHVDSVLEGELMNETFLITGASGGLIGAAFYRELFWKQKDPQSEEHRQEIGQEILNPLIFRLLVNDILFKVKSFEYAGQIYKQERGYEFEKHLSENLNGLLDRPLAAYRNAEFKSDIPTLLVSPLITNDGRKLYISPHPVSFLNIRNGSETLVQGVDFRSLLKDHQPDSLRFLTALRMSATFPYVTPTITLPTEPPIQIADAGISDNYGISDALIFLNVFKEWILENTSEVVFLTIRDSSKDEELKEAESRNILERFFSPIQSVYKSWDKVQTIKNDQFFELTKSMVGEHLRRVAFEYGQNGDGTRASLSWRLTEVEKQNIIKAIHQEKNQKVLSSLVKDDLRE